MTSIGASAFSGCSALTSITIPFVGASRTATGTNALFGYIFGISSYTGGTSTQQYYSSSDYTYYYIPTALRTVIITGATKLEYGAFYGCGGLTSIAIPNTVTGIGEWAFYGCGLTKVYYGGANAAAWNGIIMGNNNAPLTGATRYYYSATSILDGQHWHYVNGVPTVW